jgi:hypothetical protein
VASLATVGGNEGAIAIYEHVSVFGEKMKVIYNITNLVNCPVYSLGPYPKLPFRYCGRGSRPGALFLDTPRDYYISQPQK